MFTGLYPATKVSWYPGASSLREGNPFGLSFPEGESHDESARLAAKSVDVADLRHALAATQQRGNRSGANLHVNLEQATDLQVLENCGPHRFYATVSYPWEHDAGAGTRRTDAVSGTLDVHNPIVETCCFRQRIAVPYNSMQQFLKIAVHALDKDGDWLVGEATIPLADEAAETFAPWPLIRDSEDRGSLVLRVELPSAVGPAPSPPCRALLAGCGEAAAAPAEKASEAAAAPGAWRGVPTPLRTRATLGSLLDLRHLAQLDPGPMRRAPTPEQRRSSALPSAPPLRGLGGLPALLSGTPTTPSKGPSSENFQRQRPAQAPAINFPFFRGSASPASPQVAARPACGTPHALQKYPASPEIARRLLSASISPLIPQVDGCVGHNCWSTSSSLTLSGPTEIRVTLFQPSTSAAFGYGPSACTSQPYSTHLSSSTRCSTASDSWTDRLSVASPYPFFSALELNARQPAAARSLTPDWRSVPPSRFASSPVATARSSHVGCHNGRCTGLLAAQDESPALRCGGSDIHQVHAAYRWG